MTYPCGYGPAEHRRALDALLRDLETAGQSKRPRKDAKRQRAPRREIVRAAAAPGSCRVQMRVPDASPVGA